MNYVGNIIDLLCQRDCLAEVLLVPGSPPLLREPGSHRAFSEERVTAADVQDTLISLLARVPVGQKALEREGTFSFGIPQRGRMRVSYITQRGSYALSITRISTSPPVLGELLDAETAVRAAADLLGFQGGLLILASAHRAAANRLAYALLEHLNRTVERVMFAIEPCLTHILKHQRSVVMQVEVGTDVATAEQGIQNALMLGADTIYSSDLHRESDLANMAAAAMRGVLALVSVSRSELHAQFSGGALAAESELRCGVWEVEAGEGDRLRVRFADTAGQPHA